MSKRKREHFTKTEIQKVQNLENQDFILKVAIVSYADLKKWKLIDSKTFRKYLKKQIESDYEGGDLDEE